LSPSSGNEIAQAGIAGAEIVEYDAHAEFLNAQECLEHPISGDNGMAGSLELRFDGKQNFKYLTGYQLYGFVDAGTAWNDGYGHTDGLALTSAGAGVRFFLGDDLRADLAVAAPLGYRAPDNTTRSARVLFSLSNSFRLCPERAQVRCL
jgi:hypothetical protein